MDYNETIDKIITSILKQIKKAIDTKSHSDKTFKVRIIKQLGIGKYQVMYCGNPYTVSSTIQCELGDTVRVCAPCNNWQDLFIVENTSERLYKLDNR